MILYMAGGVSGNLKPFWKMVAELTAKGMEYREAFDCAMKSFLAGVNGRRWIIENYAKWGGYILNENISGKPSHFDTVQLEGEQCGCFWQGSPLGGIGGGTTQ